jgi:hypothetical protein
MDPYQTSPAIHPALPPLRLVNRRTLEHVGACPFCGGHQRSDRFHVWMEPGHERFWCRACDAKGPLKKLLGAEIRPRIAPPRRQQTHAVAQPNPAHSDRYRQVYATIALWAHALLRDEANPEPLAYLRSRGFNDDAIGHQLLGVTLRDPQAIPALLRRELPELLPDAEAAGVLVRDYRGDLRSHPNLCGVLLFPYLAAGEVVDLRTRSFPGKGYTSLPGGYAERGALFPFGWDSLDDSDTLILTEGEFKALAVTQAYRNNRLSAPAMAHPGLSYIREEWAAQLLARGVRTVILAYDSGPRPVKDGVLQLAPEETWSIRHGQRLQGAGLAVRVLRLPMAPGETKADLDAFILTHGTARLQHLIDTAPTLDAYQRSLSRSLLSSAKLALPNPYPTRRARPRRLAPGAPRPAAPPPTSLEETRAQIAALVQTHATDGQGFLVLAHVPGVGKGHNTTAGLRAFLQSHPEPGQIVWTAPRKDQLHDQQGLHLLPLYGRNLGNCQRLAPAQALAARGYPVLPSLCQRRCTHVDHCAYLRQFSVEADRFAAQQLLLATGWWQEAGVLIMDEFAPALLIRSASLSSADLAAIARGTTCPHAQAVLRWLSQILGTASDRTLVGGLLLAELEAAAHAEGLDLASTLRAAEANLPDPADLALLPSLPQGAGLAEFEALPPNHLGTIITQLGREQRRHLAGAPFTSRLELGGGLLRLFLRHEHLIAQLANPVQPKIILDATANTSLLRAIFPATPIQIEQPPRADQATVIQVITRDWAKSTLRGARRTQWHDTVAEHIRPGRPTLVVCTQDAEDDLRQALGERGHPDVTVAHYGALRGSNAYKGHDVLLAQVYHPNMEAIMREGRALFADDAEALDERIVTTERELRDATGARWMIEVPIFADPRLMALLESRREAEMVQCALRGRPLDHPEVQITLLFGLPLPGLEPSTIVEPTPTPTSNGGRQATAVLRIITAANTLIAQGQPRLTAADLAQAAQVSEVTVRTHWQAVAQALGLSDEEEHASAPTRARTYRRRVLVRQAIETTVPTNSTDQADNKDSLTCLIHTDLPAEMIDADVCDAPGQSAAAPLGGIAEHGIHAASLVRRPTLRFIRLVALVRSAAVPQYCDSAPVGFDQSDAEVSRSVRAIRSSRVLSSSITWSIAVRASP